MHTELITWHDWPADGLPDADELVLVELPETYTEPVTPGYYDGSGWYCSQGLPLGDDVIRWASQPKGGPAPTQAPARELLPVGDDFPEPLMVAPQSVAVARCEQLCARLRTAQTIADESVADEILVNSVAERIDGVEWLDTRDLAALPSGTERIDYAVQRRLVQRHAEQPHLVRFPA